MDTEKITDYFDENHTYKIDFKEYYVEINRHMVLYGRKNWITPLSGNFDNKIEIFRGEVFQITIKNVYMEFNCNVSYQQKQMFDFIARGFQIDLTKE